MSAVLKNGLFQENFMQKTKTIFMVLFFILMASLWITLAIKSKQIKIWIYSLFQFYTRHFISEDEINDKYYISAKRDI